MDNNELFNVTAALIFARCLEAHPVGVDFEFRELAFAATPGNEDGDLQDRATDVARSTLEWLGAEEFVRVAHRREYLSEGFVSVQGVTLTAKALAVLDAIPDVVRDKKSIKERLLGAVGSGSRTAMQEVIKLAIGVAASTG